MGGAPHSKSGTIGNLPAENEAEDHNILQRETTHSLSQPLSLRRSKPIHFCQHPCVAQVHTNPTVEGNPVMGDNNQNASRVYANRKPALHLAIHDPGVLHSASYKQRIRHTGPLSIYDESHKKWNQIVSDGSEMRDGASQRT